MSKIENRRYINILFVLVIICIFMFWECWNKQIHLATGSFNEDIKNNLCGFSKLDKKCMGWIMIHFPVQFYMVLRQALFLKKFAILWYFRKGNLCTVFTNFFKLYWRVPLLYYFIGLITVYLKKILCREVDDLWEGAIIFCIYVSIILMITTVAICCYTFLIYVFLMSFQSAFSIAFFLEILFTMFGTRMVENDVAYRQLWYIPVRGVFIGEDVNMIIWDGSLFLCELLKLIIIIGICNVLFRWKYEFISEN